ncbi:MAG TPA: ParB/RepB/Spo0J family partition protein [Caulobacteraceae bacterium]|nr:ParB/RepB/Spo0J family partition protein [Caulobacteraceae bacterium]
MPEIRRGLGRGLSALLDEVERPAIGGPHPAGFAELPIDMIKPGPEQPRRRFDEAELEELAQSIRVNGVLQPILVRPDGRAQGGYEIVAGERRWRAAQRTGARTVPALVRTLSDAEALEIAIIENVHRADLSPVEEAEGYRALISRLGRSQGQIGDTVGKSRAHVANALRLLQLPEPVLEHLRQGRLTAGQVRPFIGRPDAERLAARVLERRLTARQAESLAREGAKARPRLRTAKDADTLALESDLGEVLGLEVEIRDAGGAGEVRIRYRTLEQLDDVCRRLTRG